METSTSWEVIRATGGYIFVQKNNNKGHLAKRFTFWGNEGLSEARELCDYLNKQERLIVRLKHGLNKTYGPSSQNDG